VSTFARTTRPALLARPVTAADELFLRQVYAESREDLAQLPDDMRLSLLDLQYRARREQHAAAHPNADQVVLGLDGRDVGTMVVDRSGLDTWLVDLCVRADSRRQGVAGVAVGTELAIASARGRATRLHVWSANHAARALYEQLGFRYETTGEGYLQMVATTAPAEGLA
jgi:ribosomal protein S18 acetylase RimI-like enzyme